MDELGGRIMAESMQGLHRSHRCTEVSNKNIGETVTVMGWVQKRRNLGSLIFIDSWINYWIIKNIKGDVAFVFKTSVLRNYLFDDS